MSPVEFKKRLCRPVEFKGQGPPLYRPTVRGDNDLQGSLMGRGVPMLHVDFKKRQCHMSLLLIFFNVHCHYF